MQEEITPTAQKSPSADDTRSSSSSRAERGVGIRTTSASSDGGRVGGDRGPGLSRSHCALRVCGWGRLKIERKKILEGGCVARCERAGGIK